MNSACLFRPSHLRTTTCWYRTLPVHLFVVLSLLLYHYLFYHWFGGKNLFFKSILFIIYIAYSQQPKFSPNLKLRHKKFIVQCVALGIPHWWDGWVYYQLSTVCEMKWKVTKTYLFIDFGLCDMLLLKR